VEKLFLTKRKGLDVIGAAFDVSCVSLAFAVREKEAQTVCVVDVGHDFSSAQIVSVDPSSSTLTVLATASRSSSLCGASAFSAVLVEQWSKLLLSKHKVEFDPI
jgi:molecular chaperone DnaK (HSP70)